MSADNVRIAIGCGSLGQKIDLYFVNLGLGLNPHDLRRARMGEIIRLEMHSDDQLARMGLSRDQILPHVFRDLLAS